MIEWIDITEKEPTHGQLVVAAYGSGGGFVSAGVGRWCEKERMIRGGGVRYLHPDLRGGKPLFWAPFNWPDEEKKE